MARCGDCEHYRSSLATGVASGMCNQQKTGEMSYKLVMYHDNADNCPHFEQLNVEDVRTDSAEARYDVRTYRPFKDFGEKKIDTSVDKDKLSDTKDWG